ncbi:MAG: arginine--tRNA ligase [Chloroflexi bacterium]|nr:arginine--tRNA ligase [Chloroflexota bacterium]
MIRDEIAGLVRQAADAAIAGGALPSVPVPEVTVERPRQPEHGDYSTNLPMKMQRSVGGNPLQIAEKILAHLPASVMVGAAEVAKPAFINFRLNEQWLAEQVETIRQAGEAFADSAAGAGERVQVEFVSANPTGPLTVGNGRGAVIGSTLAAVLEATGRSVQREYYVNDAGTQIEVFSRTLYARYQQLYGREVEIPPDGYPGDYMITLAERLREQYGDRFLRPVGEPGPPELGPLGIDGMVASIQHDLGALGVHYDVWFREQSLYSEGGQYQRVMQLLRERGYIAEKEGAVWFTSSEVGEDKDNVLIRSTGQPTYFASDIAYHYNKFIERGFNRVVDVWGADHHGHVSRLKTSVQAIGGDPENLTIILYQLVTLYEDGKPVKFSKRQGRIYLLRELVEEVGLDACRFFFLQRSANATLEFDIDLAKTESSKNPVYYVQYAHARIAGILRRAAEQGLTPEGGDVSLLTHPAELALIRKILQLPELLDLISRSLDAHHLPYFAMDLANTFHAFYTDVSVLSQHNKKVDIDVPAEYSRARLKLVAAAKIALARTLHLMGMSTPEVMTRRDRGEMSAGDEDDDE